MAEGSKTSSKKRDSLKALRSDLSAITSRLQAADNATEQTVAALKTALHALAKHGDDDSLTEQKRHKALEYQISALQTRLTSMVRDTQKAINTDLKNVLNDPRLSTLAQAIDSADIHLRKTETAQAQNFARLQGYIASLAREVDTSLGQERKARLAALAAVERRQNNLQSDLKNCTDTLKDQSASLQAQDAKIKSVETDTSTALIDMGEKIASFAQHAAETRQEQEREIKGKVSDIALETQRNFDLYRDGFDRNIEAIQAAHEVAKRDFTENLEDLRTRLETLEYGMRPASAGHNTVQEDAFTPPTYSRDNLQESRIEDAPTSPLSLSGSDIVPNAQTYEADRFAPKSIPSGQDTVNPYAQTHTPRDAAHTLPLHTPYQPNESALPDVDVAYEKPFTAPTQPQDFYAAEQNTDYNPVETHPHTLALQDGAGNMPYPAYDEMPYADPAYAESQTTMQQARPGSPAQTASGGAKRSAIFTPGNLRAAVLGVVVLGGSYLAYSQVFGHKSVPDTTLPDNVFVESTPSDLVADNADATASNPTTINSLDPIGNYAEDLNRPINNTNTARTALEAAALDGNAIAEYQFGLIKLQNGEVESALTFLRNSANKGQAAAQYRLAKLYETGNGLEKDLLTARDLIEKAARSGNRIAMHDLANFYANGIGGTEQDLEIAAQWFEKAAERGVVDSQYNTGYLYEFGFGVTKNPVEAYVWYGIAANQGDTEAGRRITALNETLSAVETQNAKNRIDGFKPVKLDQVANGIFENLPWQKRDDLAVASDQVVKAQSLLNTLGFSAGSTDGEFGAQTRNAIIAFERANGLPETGRINASLVNQLELAAGV